MKLTIISTPVYTVKRRVNTELGYMEWYNNKKNKWLKVSKWDRLRWRIINRYLKVFKTRRLLNSDGRVQV